MPSTAGQSSPTGQEARLPAPPVHRPLPLVARWALLAFAILCLLLGIIGVFVPGLPTTVFILMAAWAAARSSPRLHEWLWYHPLFGIMLRDWANGGRVNRRSKWSATLLMTLCGVILFATTSKIWIAAMACVFMACVLAWLWFRPEPA
ncbi:MAG: YbaN family protein [Burkholderiaceae bacterium]|nr:YbaN family protein [Burkholderiaceae bacterium]